MADQIQKNGIGVRFIGTITEDGVSVDVSTATSKKMLFKKPSGATLTVDASFLTDGSDGQIYYDSQVGDLDEAGAGWELQGYVILTSPRAMTLYSKKDGFFVHDNIVAVP